MKAIQEAYPRAQVALLVGLWLGEVKCSCCLKAGRCELIRQYVQIAIYSADGLPEEELRRSALEKFSITVPHPIKVIELPAHSADMSISLLLLELRPWQCLRESEGHLMQHACQISACHV